MVEVGGDVVLDGAHVQWGIPGSHEGLPVNQWQLGRFLTKGRVKEKEQPGAGEGDRYDVVGGGCPARWHHRHPGVQEEQLSIILNTERERESERGRKAREKNRNIEYLS